MEKIKPVVRQNFISAYGKELNFLTFLETWENQDTVGGKKIQD